MSGSAVRLANVLGYAARALLGHRLRSLLSIVGMAVGIAAVIALTALGEGARGYVVREFLALGSNLLIVIPGKVETTGAMPFGGVVHDLTLDDQRAIEARLSKVRHAAPVSMGTETIRFGGRGRAAPVLGTSAAFRNVRQLSLAAGRFLSPGDVDQGGTEVVLGTKVARELFGTGTPLGQVVRIGDWRFRVVGVLAPKGRSLGFDMDDLVIVPVRTGMSMFNRRSLFRILIEVRSRQEMEKARLELIALLAERHRVEDVTVISQDAVLSAFGSILGAMTLALAAIASVSLVVAGVGIMNVMLVSVTERRAEIGLLKALGAANRQVLQAFLIEAAFLAVAGGLLGLGVGWTAVRLLVVYAPDFPASPPAWAVVAAVLVSLLMGLGFGVWPARRATRLDPVAALRGR